MLKLIEPKKTKQTEHKVGTPVDIVLQYRILKAGFAKDFSVICFNTLIPVLLGMPQGTNLCCRNGGSEWDYN